MNGLIVLSLDSGLLLYATKQLGAFGFNQSASQNIDAMQLSSTIFALYTSTSSEDGESADAASAVGVNPCFAVNEPSISWVEQGAVLWVFLDISYQMQHSAVLGPLKVLFVGSFSIDVPKAMSQDILLTIAKNYVAIAIPKEPCPKLDIYPSLHQYLTDRLVAHYCLSNSRDLTEIPRNTRRFRVVYTTRFTEWDYILQHIDSSASAPSNSVFDTEETRPVGLLPPIRQASARDKVASIDMPLQSRDSAVADTISISRPNSTTSIFSGIGRKSVGADKPPVSGTLRPTVDSFRRSDDIPSWRRLFNFGRHKTRSDNDLRSKKNIFSTTVTNGLPQEPVLESHSVQLNSYQSHEQFAALPPREILFTARTSSVIRDTTIDVSRDFESMVRIFEVDDKDNILPHDLTKMGLFIEVVKHLLNTIPEMHNTERRKFSDATLTYQRQTPETSVADGQVTNKETVTINFAGTGKCAYLYVEVSCLADKVDGCPSLPPHGWRDIAHTLMSRNINGKKI